MEVMPTFPSGEAGVQLRRMLWPILCWCLAVTRGHLGHWGHSGQAEPLVPARCPLGSELWDLWLCCQCWSCVSPVCQAEASVGSCPVSPVPVLAAVGSCHLCRAAGSADTLGASWALGHSGAPGSLQGDPRGLCTDKDILIFLPIHLSPPGGDRFGERAGP